MTETPAPSLSPTSPPRSRRRFWILISLVVLVIGLWSAYWTVARGMAVDILRNTYDVRRPRRALVCGAQRLGGYPFRFELECQPFEAGDAQGRDPRRPAGHRARLQSPPCDRGGGRTRNPAVR
ncbi:MAG: hypothetical protein HPM95_11600 [Alphaproteobacteria bacterium]|nr:hypothetical protein [Alphaproteobacteria bacterium]